MCRFTICGFKIAGFAICDSEISPRICQFAICGLKRYLCLPTLDSIKYTSILFIRILYLLVLFHKCHSCISSNYVILHFHYLLHSYIHTFVPHRVSSGIVLRGLREIESELIFRFVTK
jgi:hypothetical protein